MKKKNGHVILLKEYRQTFAYILLYQINLGVSTKILSI
jgi:hypothetical protein